MANRFGLEGARVVGSQSGRRGEATHLLLEGGAA
jgi:hypothetical protein